MYSYCISVHLICNIYKDPIYTSKNKVENRLTAQSFALMTPTHNTQIKQQK